MGKTARFRASAGSAPRKASAAPAMAARAASLDWASDGRGSAPAAALAASP